MHKHAAVTRTCQCVCVKRDWIAKATAAGSYVGKTPRLNSTNAQVESAGKWKVFKDGQKRVHLDAVCAHSSSLCAGRCRCKEMEQQAKSDI